MGGAVSRVGEDETALGGRDAAYAVHALSMWENSTEAEANIAWTREFMEAMEPFAIQGISLNFTSDQSEGKVKASFGLEKYERLVREVRASVSRGRLDAALLGRYRY